MGSGSSKDAAAAVAAAPPPPSSSSTSSTSSSSGRVRKSAGKCRGVKRVLFSSSASSSSCFGRASFLSDDDEYQVRENERSKCSTYANGKADSKSDGDSNKDCNKFGLAHHRKMPSLPSSDDNQGEGGHNETLQSDAGASSSSTANTAIGSLQNLSGRLCSRFSCIPEGISFGLNRAVSLGSSRSHSLFPAAPTASDGDAVDNVVVDNGNTTQGSTDMESNSYQDVAQTDVGAETALTQNANISLEPNSARMRHSYRRLGPHEPLECNVRFSRTLSVGRLRERVLRRTSFSEGLLGPAHLQDRSMGQAGQASEGRVLHGGRREISSSTNIELLLDSSTNLSSQAGSSVDINDDLAPDTLHQQGVNNHDLSEHRSAFLERRRRIRSQVRALQRLGSRFESLSGHDRSCILSGQHRTGRCTCQTSNRAANPDDDTSTRASISRIVMLAEALFEVLDEIHQQSVALSSRPSFSSIGSVPAPKDIVECIPIKTYTRLSNIQNEEAAQCYICLVEYEEGDCMRVLPCNHEFHRTCVDKWLKEIHRVCPLCRGDVCSSEASNIPKLG